jgi:hypothetical protein
MRTLMAIQMMTGISLVMASTFAFADGSAPVNLKRPCMQIEQACTAAGYVKGEAKEGKGFHKNCMRPILKGQSVPGVSVNPSVVQACVAKRAANQQKKQSTN